MSSDMQPISEGVHFAIWQNEMSQRHLGAFGFIVSDSDELYGRILRGGTEKKEKSGNLALPEVTFMTLEEEKVIYRFMSVVRQWADYTGNSIEDFPY
jgi:hypothetical protein